jgi:hypothetical protein
MITSQKTQSPAEVGPAEVDDIIEGQGERFKCESALHVLVSPSIEIASTSAHPLGGTGSLECSMWSTDRSVALLLCLA